MTCKLRPAPSPNTTSDKDVGAGRTLHAYPHDSDIALCGALKARRSVPAGGRRCPACEVEAGRKDWTGR